MGLASQQKELCKFFCPFRQIFVVKLRQFQLDVRLGNWSARFPTPRSLGMQIRSEFNLNSPNSLRIRSHCEFAANSA